MVLVLTNDDGIDAPGLKALRQAVSSLGYDAIVVAPAKHQSGCGHQVTTTKPIRVQQRSPWEFAIEGTPADCIRIALSHLCTQADWVLSGINSGGNLGADIYISGTVAAVREAALHGVSGIAFSHYRQGKREIDWKLAADLTAGVLVELMAESAKANTFWNVNLPHLNSGTTETNSVFCFPSTQPLPAVYRIERDLYYYAGEYSKRLREPGSDVETCFAGQIAITQLCL